MNRLIGLFAVVLGMSLLNTVEAQQAYESTQLHHGTTASYAESGWTTGTGEYAKFTIDYQEGIGKVAEGERAMNKLQFVDHTHNQAYQTGPGINPSDSYGYYEQVYYFPENSELSNVEIVHQWDVSQGSTGFGSIEMETMY